MTNTAIETQDVCLCARCLHAKPVSQFRRRRRDEPCRQRTCRACHTAIERERRSFHRSRDDRTKVRRFVTAINAAPTSHHIAVLTQLVERELGGVERLAEEWLAHFHTARHQRGSKRAADFYNAILRLNVAVAELSPKPRDLSQMSDEELESELKSLRLKTERLNAEHLENHLDEILNEMKRQGWTITPPPEIADETDEVTQSHAAVVSLI